MEKNKCSNLVICGENAMSILPMAPQDAVISIVSPRSRHPARLDKREKTLFLQFLDLSPHEISKHAELQKRYQAECMTKDHAIEIIHFVEQLAIGTSSGSIVTPNVIVHCEAGVSRSPAVAIALSIIYNLQPTPTELFREHAAYNSYVLSMILDTWRVLDCQRRLLESGCTPFGDLLPGAKR